MKIITSKEIDEAFLSEKATLVVYRPQKCGGFKNYLFPGKITDCI